MKNDASVEENGFIMKTVRLFLTGPLSIIFIALAILLGLMAVFMTPREEEPQIVVPMIDVQVSFPGHSPGQVEQLVAVPLERLLWQIEGVEHVYSVSRRDAALVTVRFHVGEDRDRAMVRVRDRINANLDRVPSGVVNWRVNSVEIDDVPVVTLTLYSPGSRSPYELRRFAEELKARLDSLRDISQTEIFGGYQRQILIEPRIEDMAARRITLSDIKAALKRNNVVTTVGKTVNGGHEQSVITAPGLESSRQIEKTVISAQNGKIVRLEDVATVKDGPTEQRCYVNTGFGPAAKKADNGKNAIYPAVTLAFSKKKGTNAVAVAENIIRSANKLKKSIVPDDVRMILTRDYGETANAKVNNLISSMIFAILTVVILITITMGWREGMVVGLAVPVSFALALFVNYLAGFTINRVTLFALILSLGLVVDDPITNVDNIQRHIRMGLVSPFKATLRAVHEVLPPVIMSTLAIIISFIPMFFITGMMGPYMGPMAINVPLTVTFSTICALTFVPWLSFNLLKKKTGNAKSTSGDAAEITPERVKKIYAFMIRPFLKKRNAIWLIVAALLLLGGSMLLMLFKVPLKMLPFDNKNELQLVLKLPEGTTLEETSQAARDLERHLATINEVKNFQAYVGINAPIDFNGLVRHYGSRRESNLADIRINLADKARRKQQSHTIALRVRDKLTAIAAKYNAVLNIVEVPPGPPVLATLTVEVGGQPEMRYAELIAGAKAVEERLRKTDAKHIVEIDDWAETPHARLVFNINRDKASLHGITAAEITGTLSDALSGSRATLVRDKHEREPLYAYVRLPYADRADIQRLGQMWLKAAGGKMVQLAELGKFETETEEQPIYHKNLERVVFVTAECVGRAPGELIIQTLFDTLRKFPLPKGITAEWAGEGEWQITLRVFRDLGIAFGVAMIGIFLLLIIQTNSVVMPLIIMCAIPLTIIGIAPGFYLLNLIMGRTIAEYADPVFFTATGMIGMIALGGIVIRNSIVLIEFIHESQRQGNPLEKAILESGAVRFRPIMLTALTTMMGAWPITLDPIFSGLAWALIFGLIASTFFTMLVIPAIYMLANSRKQEMKNAKNG